MVACSLIWVAATDRTKGLAFLLADWLNGDGEQEAFPQDRVQIQDAGCRNHKLRIGCIGRRMREQFRQLGGELMIVRLKAADTLL
jgi:hypothetical protein